jgi:hypothetical protein
MKKPGLFGAASFAALCALAINIFLTAPAAAQVPEIKEKPRMYSYVSLWQLPRPQWPEFGKNKAETQPIFDKALAGGGIVAYGEDQTLVHTAEGYTHDRWWSAMSLAGVLNVLDQIYKSGSPASPMSAAATKHADMVFVSRFYNWKPGTYKDAYTEGSYYKLKADAPDDSIEKLARHVVGPVMEKLLADGAIVEWEIDTLAVHTEAPGMFYIFVISPNAEGLDKVNAAIRESFKSNPLGIPAFDAVVDYSQHRDDLARTNAVYK